MIGVAIVKRKIYIEVRKENNSFPIISDELPKVGCAFLQILKTPNLKLFGLEENSQIH